MKTIQLLESDSMYGSLSQPITSLTFYSGNASSIETFLKQRIYEITELNPWLLGSLRKEDSHLNLVYSNENIADEFKRKRTIIITEDSQLNECADYDDIITRIKNLNISLNYLVVNKDESLFRVCLIRISSTKFAILFSLNHTLGDGYTFYQLYGMLNQQSKPRSLIVDRFHEFDAMKEELIGRDNWYKLSFILKLVLKSLFCKPYIGTIHNVDLIAIEEFKVEYKKQSNSPDDFISTNDILTSWYFSNCKMDVGDMAVGLRDRFSQLTPDHAGNYISSIMYQKGDFEHPSKIRASMKSCRRVKSDIPLISSFQCAVSGKKYTFITSWVSLYMDVELSDCNQIIHLPIFYPQSVFKFGVLFRAKKDELKCLTLSKDKSSSRKTIPNRN